MKTATSEENLFIQRCIDLALNGSLYTRPNPMVGCVIVADDKIIGEGWHKKFGEAHAEVNAINSVKEPGKLKKATLYVNLEPCSHFGKTPPCADLIIQTGIPKVVIGNIDPHDKVAGKGIEKLKNAGCEVITGVMEKECRDLNKMFFTYHEKKRPYIILKWAESADGFIDKLRDENNPVGPNWITNEKSRQLVHKWRAECQAIMVGANTVKKDNPVLNVRSWPGNNPLRVIIDRYLDIRGSLNIFNNIAPTLVFNYKKSGIEKNIEYIKIKDGKPEIEFVLETLFEKQVISLFVEGGTKLLQKFINYGLWDEARVFRGGVNFQNGIKAPLISDALIQYEEVFDTQIVYMCPKSIF